MSINSQRGSALPERCVASDMPVLEVLPQLLASADRRLTVCDGRDAIGVIDESSMLEGLGRLMPARDDSSVIVVECAPESYSASSIAHAVEDADAHLVDMISRPGSEGRLNVTLRVRMTDPSAAVRSLERYGYEVVESSGREMANAAVAEERLSALQVYLNV